MGAVQNNNGKPNMHSESKTEIEIFKMSDNTVSVDVRFEKETVWLAQA